MQIKDIIEAIQSHSSDLEKPDIMAALVGYIADYYGLKNQKKQDFKWVSNRTSEIMASNKIPQTIVKAIGLDDFGDCLDSMVTSFFQQNGPQLELDPLKEELIAIYKRDSAEEAFVPESVGDALKACLSRFFKQAKAAYDFQLSKASLLDRSLFVSIINGVIKLNASEGIVVKHEKPYSLENKMALNGIEGELKERISDSFYRSFDVIESAFEFLSQFNISIKTKFLTVMGGFYSEYLIRKGLSRQDSESIKKAAPDLLLWVEAKVVESMEEENGANCFKEELSAYSSALTAYAFYKCRILIPMEAERDH